MASLTILVLNDDCLSNIVSNLDEFSSFYNFALTCKRFHQVCLQLRNFHDKLLERKAEFFAKQFIVLKCRFQCDNGFAEFLMIQELFNIVTKFSISPGSILREMVSVWENFGPVAAKLFSWIKNKEEAVTEDTPRSTSKTTLRKMVLHLPKCDQEFTLNTSTYEDYYGAYNVIKVAVVCGEMYVECRAEVELFVAENYRSLTTDEIKGITDPLREVIHILQNELGDTTLPITDHFFVWFSFFFLSKPTVEITGEEKLAFKDEAKNQRPTIKEAEEVFAKKSMPENFNQAIAESRTDLFSLTETKHSLNLA